MSTPTLILHHYALSPFSEKTRVMLAYAGIPWLSAVTREFPPRPVLAQLAGGYRKVPVGQIGADVFCDSKIIAEEIAALAGKPALSLAGCEPAVQDYVRSVDLEIFLACIMQARPLALLRNGGRMNPLDVIRLVIDRVQIGRRSAVKPSSVAKPGRRVREHLADLDQRLQRHDFLFGDDPNHAEPVCARRSPRRMPWRPQRPRRPAPSPRPKPPTAGRWPLPPPITPRMPPRAAWWARPFRAGSSPATSRGLAPSTSISRGRGMS